MKKMKIGTIEYPEFPVFLAPMEDVTDSSFRRICKQFGADMLYTEFISSEGLIRDASRSTRKLDYHEEERPIGIQIFGGKIESMVEATIVASEANPDLIDINFGCPVKKVVAKFGGAGILQNIPMMVEMTRAIVLATNLPVTVKTRLGWDDTKKDIVSIAERLQDVGIEALTIHGRTRSQLYRGEADWTLIGEVKNNPRMHIPIIGNGDITSAEKAIEYKNRYGVDAIMIGRAAIGNPWIFREVKQLAQGKDCDLPDISERISVLKRHIELAAEWKGLTRSVNEMRKHYTTYFKGIPNIKDYRLKLVTAPLLDDVYKIFDEMEEVYANVKINKE